MHFLFDFHISPTTISLLSCVGVCVFFLLIFYRKRIFITTKYQERCNNQPQDTNIQYPSTSIIVYADDEATNLTQLLPQLLEQKYPASFEVIVVNDGASESTRDVVNELELLYPNLYLTFTPDRSRNLSRKKLALTLGIKAARHEVVVLINANSRVNSDQWLKLITRNFNDKTEIVIGYATPNINTDNVLGRRRRAFDRVAEAITYLSAAIGDSPYRGFSYNLAYRRQCFFDNKGFSRSLNLHYGDDDIFINEICNPHNTAVELATESIVECRFHNHAETHKILKHRYSYTSRFINKGPRYLMGFYSFVLWIWLLLSITTVLISLPNLLPTAIVFILGLTLWVPIILTWRKAMNALQSRKLLLTIPWFVMTRPFYNAIYKLNSRRNYRQNHTWIKR